MFTGIVSERARVASFDNGRLVVQTEIPAEIGDSVAVSGVCLTVTEARDGQLAFDVMTETLRRAKPFGSEVNLEGALRAGEPLGGHYVQGHVDAMRGQALNNAYQTSVDALRGEHLNKTWAGSPGITAAGTAIANARHDALPVSTVVTTSTSDGFNWSDAGIGAAVTFGVVLFLLTAMTLGRKYRGRIDRSGLARA